METIDQQAWSQPLALRQVLEVVVSIVPESHYCDSKKYPIPQTIKMQCSQIKKCRNRYQTGDQRVGSNQLLVIDLQGEQENNKVATVAARSFAMLRTIKKIAKLDANPQIAENHRAASSVPLSCNQPFMISGKSGGIESCFHTILLIDSLANESSATSSIK